MFFHSLLYIHAIFLYCGLVKGNTPTQGWWYVTVQGRVEPEGQLQLGAQPDTHA